MPDSFEFLAFYSPLEGSVERPGWEGEEQKLYKHLTIIQWSTTSILHQHIHLNYITYEYHYGAFAIQYIEDVK